MASGAEGFWSRCRRDYLARLEAANKKKDEEKFEKTLEKIKKQPEKKKKRKQVVEEEEEDSHVEYEDDSNDEEPPQRAYKRLRKYQRVNKKQKATKKKRGDDDDFLELCQQVGPVIDNVPKDQCTRLFPLLSKKYKRSLVKGVNEMFRGSLKGHMTPEEKQLFRDNKDSVNKLLNDHELKCNPFDEKLAPVAKTVYGLVGELENTTGAGHGSQNKGAGSLNTEDSEWGMF